MKRINCRRAKARSGLPHGHFPNFPKQCSAAAAVQTSPRFSTPLKGSSLFRLITEYDQFSNFCSYGTNMPKICWYGWIENKQGNDQ